MCVADLCAWCALRVPHVCYMFVRLYVGPLTWIDCFSSYFAFWSCETHFYVVLGGSERNLLPYFFKTHGLVHYLKFFSCWRLCFLSREFALRRNHSDTTPQILLPRRYTNSSCSRISVTPEIRLRHFIYSNHSFDLFTVVLKSIRTPPSIFLAKLPFFCFPRKMKAQIKFWSVSPFSLGNKKNRQLGQKKWRGCSNWLKNYGKNFGKFKVRRYCSNTWLSRKWGVSKM